MLLLLLLPLLLLLKLLLLKKRRKKKKKRKKMLICLEVVSSVMMMMTGKLSAEGHVEIVCLKKQMYLKRVNTAVISSGFPPSYLYPCCKASCSKGVVVFPQLYFNVTPTMAFTISCKFSTSLFSEFCGNPSFQNVLNRDIKSRGHMLSKKPSVATRHKSPA